MLEKIPSPEELQALLGEPAYDAWVRLCAFIGENYRMESVWDSGGKYGKAVLRFRKSGKTLCTLYAREQKFGCWLICGKAEREKFERCRTDYSDAFLTIYDNTPVYHDGKWVMLELSGSGMLPDIERMLLLKRKPEKRS